MTDPPVDPESQVESITGPDRRSADGAPPWVRVLGIIAIVLVVLFVVLHLIGGGGGGAHVPARHTQLSSRTSSLAQTPC